MVFSIKAAALIELVQQYGVLAVIAGALIEEIFVPIPSPVIPMAAGGILIEIRQPLIAMLKIMFYIAIPASAASVVSSYFVYGITYYGGKPVIQRYGKFLGFKWEEVEGLERHFGHEQTKHYVALFRAIPIMPLSMISGAAGLFRMDWKEYGVWTFIGMMPRNFFLALIGWYFRDGFLALASRINTLSTGIAVVTVVLIVGYIFFRKTDHLTKKYLLKSC